MYFNSGGTITLTCMISQSPVPPAFVFWYHNDRMINYDDQRGGISVNTTKGNQTLSTLIIQNALRSDSGNYTCSPSTADQESVVVHVLNGEKPAAMQDYGKARGYLTTSRMSDLVMGLLIYISTMYFGLR
uniref:Ig-like domain-containing protein n=1 Tax=Strigamia maritima TaxID=126957 RepID=T1JE39_STRMM